MMENLKQNVPLHSEKATTQCEHFLEYWNSFRKEVKGKCTPTAYGNWIEPCKATIQEGKRTIEIPNSIVREYILSNYKELLLKHFPDLDFGFQETQNKEKIEFMIMPFLKPFTPIQDHNFYDPKKEFLERIPPRFHPATFEKCDRQKKEIIEYGREWIKKPRPLLINGNLGRGKTQFAWAMIGEAFEIQTITKDCMFFDGPELDSLLLDAVKSERGDYHTLKKIRETQFLFIDDIGRETDSERFRRQFFEIMNYRYAYLLPTLMTSNLEMNELAQRLGPATVSRMQDWENIFITGPDLRK